MNQQEEILQARREQETLSRPPATSRRVTDHLANERTFLAWIRTGLATITLSCWKVATVFGVRARQVAAKAAKRDLASAALSA